MKVGIVTDGKYGDRAYENIKNRFTTEWILVEVPNSSLIDDLKLNLPRCNLYISYLSHPDAVMAVLEQNVPTILGISFGLGFLKQAREINENVIAPVTMCSLEDNTGVKEFDEYSRFYGRPKFDVTVDSDIIWNIKTLRESPCTATRGAAKDIIGKYLSKETLQFFALRVCNYCRAPRFGKTCDKEFAGINHIRELTRSILESDANQGKTISEYAKEIEELYTQKRSLLYG
jgi:hypothetical protein